MNIGDRIMKQPETFGTGIDRPGENAKHTALSLRGSVGPLPGTVTYINHKRRWYQVTFDIGIKECFFFDIEPEAGKRGRPPLPNGYHRVI